jgi:hypothetical protein
VDIWIGRSDGGRLVKRIAVLDGTRSSDLSTSDSFGARGGPQSGGI